MARDFSEVDKRALDNLAKEMDSDGFEYLVATHGPGAVSSPITAADLAEMFPLGAPPETYGFSETK